MATILNKMTFSTTSGMDLRLNDHGLIIRKILQNFIDVRELIGL